MKKLAFTILYLSIGWANIAFAKTDKTIDVLVLYTPEVGSKYKMRNINILLDRVENVFINNKTSFKVKFKDIVKFDDSEINEKITSSAEFKKLLKKSESVRKMRIKYAADLVLVLVNNKRTLSGNMGFGYIPESRLDIGKTPYAVFRLVKNHILDKPYPLGIAHEIGHNLGLTHGFSNYTKIIRSYGKGYCDHGTYSTIMYYSKKCGLKSFKIGEYFSRNDSSFKKCAGLTCGTSQRDSMKAINKDGLLLAKWMSDIQPKIEVLITRYTKKMNKYQLSYTYYIKKRNVYTKDSTYYDYYNKKFQSEYNKYRKYRKIVEELEENKV